MAASQRTLALPLQAPGLVAGVDEAGRGPLAGPVVAAAVILDPKRRIRGINDSKQLEAEEREALYIKIRGAALAWSVAWADVEEIDCHNILQATHLAMRRALIGLHIHPGHVQVDGNLCPSFVGLPMKCSYEAIIDGDALRTCIGAASIIAKVTRDRMMCELDTIYPNYGFASHKGYSTPQHYEALDRLGPTRIHRRSFEPVRLACERLPIAHELYMAPRPPEPEPERKGKATALASSRGPSTKMTSLSDVEMSS